MNTGTCGQPSVIARVLPDGSTQRTRLRYNSKGHLTGIVDPDGPRGYAPDAANKINQAPYVYDYNGNRLEDERHTYRWDAAATLPSGGSWSQWIRNPWTYEKGGKTVTTEIWQRLGLESMTVIERTAALSEYGISTFSLSKGPWLSTLLQEAYSWRLAWRRSGVTDMAEYFANSNSKSATPFSIQEVVV